MAPNVAGLRCLKLIGMQIELSRLGRILAIEWAAPMSMLLGAVAVGSVATAYGIACQIGENAFRSVAATHSAYWALAITPAGYALIAWLSCKWLHGTERSGIPHAIAAANSQDPAFRAALLHPAKAVGRTVLGIAGAFAGACAGRQGPSAYVGAAVMHRFCRLGGMVSPFSVRWSIVAGTAGGLAAAFNTPLAGAAFAIEEMWKSSDKRNISATLAAVVIVGFVSLYALGDRTHFGNATRFAGSRDDWLAVAVCSVLAGGLGGVMARVLLHLPENLPRWMLRTVKSHPVWTAFACGTGVGLLGLPCAGLTHGSGYAEVEGILLHGSLLPSGFPLYKMGATMLTYASGITGGLFVPSMAIGVGIGSAAHTYFPNVALQTLAMIGMTAFFAGLVHTPLTAAVVVLELTDTPHMLFPVLVAALISTAVSRLICKTRLYSSLASRITAQAQSASCREGMAP